MSLARPVLTPSPKGERTAIVSDGRRRPLDSGAASAALKNRLRIYLEKLELAGVVLLVLMTAAFEVRSGGASLSPHNLRGVLARRRDLDWRSRRLHVRGDGGRFSPAAAKAHRRLKAEWNRSQAPRARVYAGEMFQGLGCAFARGRQPWELTFGWGVCWNALLRCRHGRLNALVEEGEQIQGRGEAGERSVRVHRPRRRHRVRRRHRFRRRPRARDIAGDDDGRVRHLFPLHQPP